MVTLNNSLPVKLLETHPALSLELAKTKLGLYSQEILVIRKNQKPLENVATTRKGLQ